MSRSANEIAMLEELLALATVQLFHSLGVDVDGVPEADARAPRPVVASTMGFTERGLRAAITLVLERPTVAALYPDVELSAIGAARDACGEMANMLVGQLKNQLRALGVTIQLGLPVTVSGDDLRVLAPAAGSSSWQVFEGAHGQARLRLDVQLDADFTFATDAALDLSADAGDTLFF